MSQSCSGTRQSSSRCPSIGRHTLNGFSALVLVRVLVTVCLYFLSYSPLLFHSRPECHCISIIGSLRAAPWASLPARSGLAWPAFARPVPFPGLPCPGCPPLRADCPSLPRPPRIPNIQRPLLSSAHPTASPALFHFVFISLIPFSGKPLLRVVFQMKRDLKSRRNASETQKGKNQILSLISPSFIFQLKCKLSYE